MYPPPSKCAFILSSAVIVVSPFQLKEFNEYIVEPVRSHTVSSYGVNDQGLMNTLLYDASKSTGWFTAYAVLHPRFNVIVRLQSGIERAMDSQAVALHYTGLSGRPWNMKNYSSTNDWHRGCWTNTTVQKVFVNSNELQSMPTDSAQAFDSGVPTTSAHT